MTASCQYLRFRSALGPRLVELIHVVEVIPMCQLDCAPDEGGGTYCGLLHYRGRTLPVFGVGPGPYGLDQVDYFLIVLRHSSGELALVAQGVDDIAEYPPESVSVFYNGSEQAAVVHADGELLRVVNPARVAAGS